MDKASHTIKNYKNFDSQIASIDFIESFSQTPIALKDYENCKAQVTKPNQALRLKIEGVFTNKNENNELAVIINEKEYILKSSDFASQSTKVSIFSGVYCEQTFDVYGIRAAEWVNDEMAKFRCIFPTDIERLSSFCFLLETIAYKNDTTVYAYDCIRIKVDGKAYDVIQVKRSGKGFYIIDSLEKVSLEEFEEVSYAIQQSLGFFTGYMPGGEVYFFSDTNFSYSSYTRPALKSMFNPVNSNAYAKLYHNRDAAEEFQGKLTLISMETVSNLTNIIRHNKELSVAIILLMEAASVRSLLLIPITFAVIIESLSNIIAVTESGKVTPITNTGLSKKVINELTAVIDKNSPQLNEEGALKLKRRILAINNPMVKDKLTNNEKLTIPFEQLGIKLTIEDIKAIECRNDLLHGNILLDTGKQLTSEETDDYMMYIAGKLFTLISKLILKYAKYDGYVINYAKLFNSDCDESYYDKI